MLTQTGRLARAMVLLCLGFGLVGRAEAGLVLPTPAGLSLGQSFRFVFVTDGGTTAGSSNIADYNNFVNTQAGGATYNGAVIQWNAIASTSTINAIDNVGQTETPVYLADGTLVTTSTTSTGLWSGTISHAIDELLTGSIVTPPRAIWTGTLPTGIRSAEPLGSPDLAQRGVSDATDSRWVDDGAAGPTGGLASWLYGISNPLTAVPEPSSLVLFGTGVALLGMGYAWRWRTGP